jgi:signal transduction histidine kinase
MAEALRSTTGLTVPISARGTVIGTLTVFRGGQARYEAREVASAVQLARRAGMALENARLFEQVQESASALERAGTAKDEFLGLVSHELRTPLTTLKGTASVLRRHGESISEADRLQALQDIERGADQLQRIVENMLTLAQPELAGDDELEPMLLRRVVSSVVQGQMAQFPDRQIHLSAPTELLPVMGHPAYLRQIFQNLVGNARKYSPAGSDIDVRIERSGSEVIVSVEDRGMGIGREEATRLFQPFFRTDEAARARAGLGLGLTVCKRLVEHQGGRIWAEPRDGGGTAFRFAMPVLEADYE